MNRFISAVLAAAMALSMNWMFAYADVGTPKTTSATLKATANSTYTITVPESVAMTSASGGAGNYTGTVPVNIKGDIEENAKIVVSASATAMTSGNKSAAVTFTSVPKTEWNRTDLLNSGTTANYKVQATLTPGKWTGTATFSCEKLYNLDIKILAGDLPSAPNYSRTVTVTFKEGWTWGDFVTSDYNTEGILGPEFSSEDSPLYLVLDDLNTGKTIRLCGVGKDGTKFDVPSNQRIDSNDCVRLTGWEV